MARFDVAIVGLGAMGAAAAYQLAKRGARVIGFDRHDPPHTFGSSHGETRVTRLAIGEGDHLTPLVMRSHELWREIEGETGASFLGEIGGLIISSHQNAAVTHVARFFQKTVAAAEKFGIAHELLDAAQIHARWPQFRVRDHEFGYFEPTAGFVRPEECVRAQLSLASKYGAEIRAREPVLSFEGGADGVTIATKTGRYTADRLIVAAGAWLPQLLPEYARLFRIYRQTQFWFEVEDARAFAPERFPVFIWELPNSKQGLYGFPALADERAIKVASEQFDSTTTPEDVNRTISDAEIAAMQALIEPHLAGVTPHCVETTTCLYTVTPDFGFVIDIHPENPRVLIASPCSGHGFKHSAAIGEIVAELVLDGASRLDIGSMNLRRFPT